MNPILGLEYAAPDVEAHVWQSDADTVYLYCSNDRIDGGGMDPWQKCFSSRDLLAWKDEGVAFDARKAVTWAKVENLPAIDCAEKDGRYYYYFTAPGDGPNPEDKIPLQCVASSDTPAGPFTNATPIRDTEFPSCGDPSVLVDDDGAAYLFWGQFSLRGARLKDNMREIIPETVNTMVLTEEEHGFHEGSSIRKHGDTYYMLYVDTSRGAATCLSYATATRPLGPYRKGGVIIDNAKCDIASWNNHGSMLCFKNQWYIVYHRATLGGEMVGRRVCMEPIEIDGAGHITEVKMTTQGVEGPLDAFRPLDAYRACEFEHPGKGQGWELDGAFFMKYPVQGFRKRMLETALINSKDNGVRTAHTIKQDIHGEYLTRFADGDAAVYRYLDFGAGATRFVCEAASYLAVTHLEIRLDAPDGECIGVCEINHSGGWADWKRYSCAVKQVPGVHALYLVAKNGGNGSRLCDLNRFWFEEDEGRGARQ